MHKWVVGPKAQPVQKDDEEIPIKWTKREKALIVVVVFLIGVVGITGWYVLSETHKEICESFECIEQAAWLLSSIDQETDPCDNFHDFVCNSKLQRREQIMLRNSANNFSIFTTKSAATDLILSKIRNVYNVCMNTEELEMHFKVFLERFLYFEDTLFDWRLFLYKARKYGLKYDMLFKFRVIEDEDDAFLRIEPPFIHKRSDIITIFNMSFTYNYEALKWMAATNDELIFVMTIKELEQKFLIPSLETIRYLTRLNFTEDDVIQLQAPSYFEQLKLYIFDGNATKNLQNYLRYEIVRQFVSEFEAISYKGDNRSEFCISKAMDIIPFTIELKYMEQIIEIENVAKNIIEEFLGTYKYKEKITTITLNEILNDYQSFPILKNYFESYEESNYMQLIANSHVFQEDCYYSTLKKHENPDLSCMLYNTDVIKIYNNSMVITAKILKHLFYHKNKAYTPLNYASVGNLIGRELMTTLIKTTSNSNSADKIMQCLFDQQINFYDIPDNIEAQQAEDMFIDLAGTLLAYRTYLKVYSFKSQLVLPGLEYTKPQLFWLAKFRQQCDYLNNFSQVLILPFVNIMNFTADFVCTEGKYMNPVSVPRCLVL